MQDDDLFDFADEEETTPEASQDSGPMKQLRRHANKLEKDLKSRDTELEELRTFKDEFNNSKRAEKAASVFTELGLNPAHVKFWQLENPDAEVDAVEVGKWAVENGFAQATVEASDQGSGFTPTTTPDATPPGAKRLTRAEWLALAGSDSAAAQLAFQKGRVDLSEVRQGLGPTK